MTGIDYRRLFRAVPGSCLVLTPDLVMVEATEARLLATRTRRDDLIGRRLFDVFSDDPDDPAASGVKNLAASLDRVRAELVPDVMPVQKYSLRRPPEEGGGFEERYWTPLNVPVLGEAGELRLIIHAVEDVTDFVRAAGEAEVARPAEGGDARSSRLLADAARRSVELLEANRSLRSANEAIRQARDQARAAEARTAEVIASIGDPFFAIDDADCVTYVNDAALHAWGRNRPDVTGRSLFDAWPELDRAEVRAAIAESRLRGAVVNLELGTRSGASRWLLLRLFPARQRLSCYVKDITDRKIAESERDWSMRVLQLVRRAATAANVASEPAEAFHVALDAICEAFGWAAGHAVIFPAEGVPEVAGGEGLWVIRHRQFAGVGDAMRRDELPHVSRLIATVARTGTSASHVAAGSPDSPDSRDSPGSDDSRAAGDDARRPAPATGGVEAALAVPVIVGDRVRAVLAFILSSPGRPERAFLDVLGEVAPQLARVIERDDAMLARRELLRRLVTAQEEERRRVSRELHDQMGQLLTALAMGVKQLRPALDGVPGGPERLRSLEELADQAAEEGRTIAHRLRPTILEDFGLEAAIRSDLDQWTAGSRVAVIVHTSGLDDARITAPIETALYGIVVEALTNIARHARATQVNVVLEVIEHTVIAVVEDNGAGFDADAPRPAADAATGLGLRGMRERVQLLGGALVIESAPGEGTSIIARVPLRNAHDATLSPGRIK